MSLVNDLLIEAERRRSGSRRRRSSRIDDLVPARPTERTASGGAIARALGIAIACAGITGALGWAYVETTGRPSLDESGRERRTTRSAGRPTPPPVAARIEARAAADFDSAARPGVPAGDSKASSSRRPVGVESIVLERRDDATRIRIATDERTAHRIDHDPRTHRLELVLAGSSLVAPTDRFDLLNTPIRSLELREESPDLRLTFELDRNVRVLTRWTDRPHGAALVVDLQSPIARRTRSFDELPPISAESPNESPAEPFVDAPPVRITPRRAVVADQVVSPSLGDPNALRIEPSVGERDRTERAAREAAFADSLESARRLRAAGRLEEADVAFGELALVSPDDRRLTIERSELKLELGRPRDAFELVRALRRVEPREPDLIVAEARLLEKTGDLASAIRLLDQSELSVTDAPAVHALAAAYHQRAGNHATAITRYEELLRRFPEEAPGWMGLGISFEAEGRPLEARDVYRISLMVGELPTPARRWVADRLAALGEKD